MAKYRSKTPPVDAFQYTGDLNALDAWCTSLATPVSFAIDTTTTPQSVTVQATDSPTVLDVTNFVVVDEAGTVSVFLSNYFLDSFEIVTA